MKRISGVFTAILFLSVSVSGLLAQPVEGKKFEFSTSASMWNVKYKDSDETSSMTNVSLRVGIFIFKGLEIEPELFLTIPEDGEDTGYFVMANLAYNFKASERLIPFILGGVGYGNGQPALSLVYRYWEDMNVTAFNLGAGIKFIVGDSAAIRIEYRLTRYSGESTETYWGYTYTYELDRTDNNILVGMSIFF